MHKELPAHTHEPILPPEHSTIAVAHHEQRQQTQLEFSHPGVRNNGPPPGVLVHNLRFKRPPPNPTHKEPTLSATTEEGFGAGEMGHGFDRRALFVSRSQQTEMTRIEHPTLDPTLTVRMQETTLLMKTPRTDGPYSQKLKKKKKHYWYIRGQEAREDQSGREHGQQDQDEPEQQEATAKDPKKR